jgi:hypothetical protein
MKKSDRMERALAGVFDSAGTGSSLTVGYSIHGLHEAAIVTQVVFSGRVSLTAFRTFRFSYCY